MKRDGKHATKHKARIGDIRCGNSHLCASSSVTIDAEGCYQLLIGHSIARSDSDRNNLPTLAQGRVKGEH